MQKNYHYMLDDRAPAIDALQIGVPFDDLSLEIVEKVALFITISVASALTTIEHL